MKKKVIIILILIILIVLFVIMNGISNFNSSLDMQEQIIEEEEKNDNIEKEGQEGKIVSERKIYIF